MTAGTLTNADDLGYFINGCTVSRLEVFASSAPPTSHVFAVISASGALATSYTVTSATCTMTSADTSCVYAGPNVTIAAGSLIGVVHWYSTSNSPAGWQIRMAVRCQ